MESAQNITGDTDVSTAGTLVSSANVGDATMPATVTVNGVTFQALVAGFSTSTGVSPVTSADGVFTLNGSAGAYNGYGSSNPPFSSLSTSYQDLLRYGNNGSGASLMTLTLNQLSVGQTYQIQLWFNDSRTVFGQQPQNVSDGNGNTVRLLGDTTGTDGGTGQFVIGTFVASATTQDIMIQGESGSGTLVSAFQLRIPSGTTAASVSISGRVLTPNGAGLRNATVVMIGPDGKSRSARSNAFGYYMFTGIPAGATCALSVSSRLLTFPARIVNATDTLTGIDLIAESR